MILAAREQQLQLVWMKLELIDGLSVSNVVANRLVLFNVNDAYDAAVTSCRKQRRRRLQVI